jgi:2-keto-4-pentenoate hydratase/2-oxohepta-3-ene-1,7-dioic acid hydratase in catechol pathway
MYSYEDRIRAVELYTKLGTIIAFNPQKFIGLNALLLLSLFLPWSACGIHASGRPLPWFRIRALNHGSLPKAPSDVRIGACVSKIGKFVYTGLNYEDHAIEFGMPISARPVVFDKWTSWKRTPGSLSTSDGLKQTLTPPVTMPT